MTDLQVATSHVLHDQHSGILVLEAGSVVLHDIPVEGHLRQPASQSASQSVSHSVGRSVSQSVGHSVGRSVIHSFSQSVNQCCQPARQSHHLEDLDLLCQQAEHSLF